MKYLPIILVLLFASSCSPKLNYLGDSFPPTTNVDVYYSAKDIDVEYKVIGKLEGNNDHWQTQDLEAIKESMVETAKTKGADGILFVHFSSRGKRHRVKANLLQYDN